MRLKKTLIAIMILLFTSLAVSVKIPELLNGNEEYNQLISDADKYNEKNLCKKAMDNYAQALSINDSLDLRLTMAKVYKKGLESGEYDSFYQYYEFLLENIEKYRYEPEAYDIALTELYDSDEIEKCVLVLYKAEDNNLESETINSVREKVRYSLKDVNVSYNEVYYTNEESYLLKNDKYMLCDKNLSSIIKISYNYSTPMINGYALVKDDKYTYLISKNNVREAYFSNDIVESTGVGDGLIGCKIKDTYSYYDLSGQKIFGSYLFAGRFANGVAPVKTEKGWIIIDTKGNSVSDTHFEDVKLSQTSDCSQSGFIIAKQNGKYNLYDCKLNRVTDYSFDDSDIFISNKEYLAVKNNGKWGYIDSTGKEIIKPKYDEAKSFSYGLAGVKTGNKWAFINIKGNVVINGDYSDVNYFNSSGNCFVKNEVLWNCISRYYNR